MIVRFTHTESIIDPASGPPLFTTALIRVESVAMLLLSTERAERGPSGEPMAIGFIHFTGGRVLTCRAAHAEWARLEGAL